MTTLVSSLRLSQLFSTTLAVALVATLARGQEAEGTRRGENTIIVNDLDLDLAVPNSPALVVLGLNIDTVVRPTTPKELAAAVQNGLDRNGNFQSGAAVDFNPWRVWNGTGDTEAGIQLSEYLDGDGTLWPYKLLDNRERGTNLWRNLWYRTQVSFATTKGVTEDDDSVRVAVGGKITPFDNGDPLLLTGKCIRANVERIQNFTTSLVDPFQARSLTVEPLDQQLVDATGKITPRKALRDDEAGTLKTLAELRSSIATLPLTEPSPPQGYQPTPRVLDLAARLKKKFRLTDKRRQIVIDYGMESDELEKYKQESLVDIVTPHQLQQLIEQHTDWWKRYGHAKDEGAAAAREELDDRRKGYEARGLSPAQVNARLQEDAAKIEPAAMEKSMQKLVDELAGQIERECKNDAAKNDAWNRSAWDIAFAPAWFGEDGDYDSLKWNGGAVWSSLALGWDTFLASDDTTDTKAEVTNPKSNWQSILRNWSHLILHARYRFDEKQSASNLENPPDDFFKADSWLVGGRGRFGGPKFSLSFEGAYVRQNSHTAGVKDDTIYRLAIIPSFTFRGITLEATFGTDTNRNGKNPAFVLSSIKWSLPSPNSP